MPLIAAHTLDPSQGNPQIYNGFDVCEPHVILNKLLSLPQYGPIYKFSRAMQGPAMEMMLRGFLIDPQERENAINDIQGRLDGINAVLQALTHAIWNKGILYNGHDQIKDLFYNHLNIRPIEKWSKGGSKRPMDAETLDKLHDRYPRIQVLCSAILACRDLKKQVEKLEMEVDHDWRIRASVNIAGTNEGRFSYSQSFVGTGGNLQNVTESVRRMFISDPGWKLCGVDKEQAESRWVGLYCGILFNDWSYLDLLESEDGHTACCRMIWPELPWTGDLKKDRRIAERPFLDETFRQKSKKLSHATNILARPSPKTSAATGVPIKVIAEYQERYFARLPCIPTYHRWLAQQIQTKRFLTNIFGRRRDFFDRPDAEETVRQAAAFMQASSNADDINLGMWRMWYHMKDRVQLLTQEHDAVYFQFHEDDDEEEIISTVKTHLNVEFDLGFRKFSVPTDAKTGWNKSLRWTIDKDGNAIETNPRGLDKPGARR